MDDLVSVAVLELKFVLLIGAYAIGTAAMLWLVPRIARLAV